MWVFLATEVLFFGVLLLAYAVYRGKYPGSFGEASRHLDIFLGTMNTAVLLCSSLTMAFAVHQAQRGDNRSLSHCLFLTMGLGIVFLGIKFYEYYEKYNEGLIPGSTFSWAGDEGPHASLFFLLYFTLTGIHALHMIIGVGMLSVLAIRSRIGEFSSHYYTPVDMAGLYWHFVDIVWVFLFPLLYLVDRSS